VINAFNMPLVLWDDSRKRFCQEVRKPVFYASAAAKAGHILGRLQMIQQRVLRIPDCWGRDVHGSAAAHPTFEVCLFVPSFMC
jgi:hypothetical protein